MGPFNGDRPYFIGTFYIMLRYVFSYICLFHKLLPLTYWLLKHKTPHILTPANNLILHPRKRFIKWILHAFIELEWLEKNTFAILELFHFCFAGWSQEGFMAWARCPCYERLISSLKIDYKREKFSELINIFWKYLHFYD